MAKFFVFSSESIGVLKDRSEAGGNGVELPCEGSFLRNDLLLTEVEPFRGGLDFREYGGWGWLDAIDERGWRRAESLCKSSSGVFFLLQKVFGVS